MGRRLFLAIDINPGAQFLVRLNALRELLRDERINWVKAHNLHLTIKFLGNTEEERISAIIEALHDPVTSFPAFRISSHELGIFGARHSPKVLWLGFDEGNEALMQLGNTVLDILDKHGWPRDRQNFVPHLSFARIKQLKDRKYFQTVVDNNREAFQLSQEVRSLQLIESILHPEGPEYVELHRFELKSD